MSIGPTGFAGSIAGSPLAQTKGSEIERAQQDASNHERRVETDAKADDAAGIAATDGENDETHDRDADGRRLWEGSPQPGEKAESDETPTEAPKSKDASGMAGTQLDLSG